MLVLELIAQELEQVAVAIRIRHMELTLHEITTHFLGSEQF